MSTDDFEKKLQGQSLRRIPGEWREEILRSASTAVPAAKSAVQKSAERPTLRNIVSTLFWPHPKAWATLAAAWVLIFTVHFATTDRSPAMAKNSARPSPEVLATLKQQQQLLARLIEGASPSDADRSKPSAPQPRSERPKELRLI